MVATQDRGGAASLVGAWLVGGSLVGASLVGASLVGASLVGDWLVGGVAVGGVVVGPCVMLGADVEVAALAGGLVDGGLVDDGALVVWGWPVAGAVVGAEAQPVAPRLTVTNSVPAHRSDRRLSCCRCILVLSPAQLTVRPPPPVRRSCASADTTRLP